MVMWMGRVG